MKLQMWELGPEKLSRLPKVRQLLSGRFEFSPNSAQYSPALRDRIGSSLSEAPVGCAVLPPAAFVFMPSVRGVRCFHGVG